MLRGYLVSLILQGNFIFRIHKNFVVSNIKYLKPVRFAVWMTDL